MKKSYSVILRLKYWVSLFLYLDGANLSLLITAHSYPLVLSQRFVFTTSQQLHTHIEQDRCWECSSLPRLLQNKELSRTGVVLCCSRAPDVINTCGMLFTPSLEHTPFKKLLGSIHQDVVLKGTDSLCTPGCARHWVLLWEALWPLPCMVLHENIQSIGYK